MQDNAGNENVGNGKTANEEITNEHATMESDWRDQETQRYTVEASSVVADAEEENSKHVSFRSETAGMVMRNMRMLITTWPDTTTPSTTTPKLMTLGSTVSRTRIK